MKKKDRTARVCFSTESDGDPEPATDAPIRLSAPIDYYTADLQSILNQPESDARIPITSRIEDYENRNILNETDHNPSNIQSKVTNVAQSFYRKSKDLLRYHNQTRRKFYTNFSHNNQHQISERLKFSKNASRFVKPLIYLIICTVTFIALYKLCFSLTFSHSNFSLLSDEKSEGTLEEWLSTGKLSTKFLTGLTNNERTPIKTPCEIKEFVVRTKFLLTKIGLHITVERKPKISINFFPIAKLCCQIG